MPNAKRNVTPTEKALARLRIGQPVGVVARGVDLSLAEVQALADSLPKPEWHKELADAGLPQYQQVAVEKLANELTEHGCVLTVSKDIGKTKTIKTWEHGATVMDADGNVEHVPIVAFGNHQTRIDRHLEKQTEPMPWDAPASEALPWE